MVNGSAASIWLARTLENDGDRMGITGDNYVQIKQTFYALEKECFRYVAQIGQPVCTVFAPVNGAASKRGLLVKPEDGLRIR